MSRDADGYERLLELRRNLMAQPQSAQREYEITLLELDITQIECKLRVLAAERAEIFFRAWIKSGMMRANLPDGRIVESRPVLNLGSVDSIWIGKREACHLAALSLGLPYLPVIGEF